MAWARAELGTVPEMTDLPTGTVTFLFSDIEGSTRLFRQLGGEYHELLEQHNRLLRSAWSANGGVEVKTEGDSFFVAFQSAADALRAAVAAQDGLEADPWPGERPRVRIGIHSGLAAPVEGDYIALAVHQAARVEGAAHGGQILASEATVELGAAESGVDLRRLGHFRLRGFDDPALLYQVSSHGRDDEFPSVRAVPADGHNIARPLTTFVGRDSDIDRIVSVLAEQRLITITGPGGVGKTRLASEVGIQRADSFDGGVWLVDLSPLEPDSSIDGLVASELSVQTDGRDPVEAIAENLGTGDTLLILDTCEHVQDSARVLTDTLLRRVPSLSILTTSRIALGLPAEMVVVLDPLTNGAEELFRDRVGLTQIGVADSGEAVVEICRRLDGLPLAIELAAARSRSSSPAAVLATMDDPARFLRVRQRGSEARQESLQAVVEWSYELLEPEERRVFEGLGVFSSSFSEETGAWAAAEDPADAGVVAEAMWALADASLLQRDLTASETRYRMLETIRVYAGQVAADDERAETASRLASSFLDRIGPWTAKTAEKIGRLRAEVDNLRGLVPLLSDREPETAQMLALAVLGSMDDDGDYVSAVRAADRYVDELDVPTPVRALLIAQQAHFRHRLGDTETEPILDEAEQLDESLGPAPAWARGWIRSTRADWLDATGQTEAAIAMASEALAGSDTDRERILWLQQLGVLAMVEEPEVAVRYLEEGLAVTPEDRHMMVAAFHSNLAECLMRLDRPMEAATHQLEALRGGAQLGIAMLVALSLIVAARLSAMRGAGEHAARLHGAADRIVEDAGVALHPDDIELSEAMLSDVMARLGDGFETAWQGGYELSVADAAGEGIRALELAAGG